MVKVSFENNSDFVINKEPFYSLVTKAVLSHLAEKNKFKVDSRNKMVKRTNVFSVSQSSYDCYRKIFFEMTYPRESDVDDLGTFAGGDFIHDVYQTAMEKEGATINVVCEKDYFDNKIKIKGSCDFVFSGIVGEIKSVSSFAWKYIVGGKDRFGNSILSSPKISHVRQLNTYLDLLGLDEGYLVYVNKDTICNTSGTATRTFRIIKDMSQLSQTIGRCITVFNAIMDNRVPDKFKGSECSYCKHTDLCKKVK